LRKTNAYNDSEKDMNEISYSQKYIERRSDMPLVFAPTGRSLRIVKLLADEKTKKRLESLGLTVDSSISIISQSGGSTICLVKECRLALDRDLANKILVA